MLPSYGIEALSITCSEVTVGFTHQATYSVLSKSVLPSYGIEVLGITCSEVTVGFTHGHFMNVNKLYRRNVKWQMYPFPKSRNL